MSAAKKRKTEVPPGSCGTKWSEETLPPGWTVEWRNSGNVNWKEMYRNEATGEERVKCRANQFRGPCGFEPPAGVVSVLQRHSELL